MLKKIIGIIVCAGLLYVWYTYKVKNDQNNGTVPVSTEENQITPTPTATPSVTPSPSAPPTNTEWQFPISDAAGRVTKKPFGIYITKASSPVQPEKFSGYHTGVDFEVSDDEQSSNVEIKAICNGPILLKKWATGYGGVVSQKCNLNGEDVNVIYGHLNIVSVKNKVGDELKSGDVLGILGKGYTTETDQERKHLHLSIHKGPNLTLLGYVQNKTELNSWLDPLTILK